MQGRNSYEDELARRRALREGKAKGQGARPQESEPAREGTPADEEEMPNFTWKDILAMVIAAYQILLPFLLILIAAMLVAYLLFRYVFS